MPFLTHLPPLCPLCLCGDSSSLPFSLPSPLLLSAWLHNLSPFLVRFSESFGIRWYGLSYALGFLIGWLVIRWLARIRFTPIPPERVGDVILIWVIGVIAGGRLGYVLIYQPSLLWTIEPGAPWWGLLALNQGGMASHGGILGVIIASVFIARGFKDKDGVRRGRVSVRHVLDVGALAVPFGMFLGRLANFINGELLGRVIARAGEPAPAWSIRFPQEISEEHTLRLTLPKGYAPVHTDEQWRQITAIIDRFRAPSQSFDAGYHRMMEALQRGDRPLAQELSQLVSARHPSQLYQALAEGVILALVVWFVARKPRLPGIVGCWFMITYGALRVITEIWRLPDSHLQVPRILGLSRGQWLSAAMVAVGIAVLFWIRRNGGEKMGGWLTQLRTRTT
jgi:phosphatidylglycerol---prolipoprotein diacylglyceryl transferase